MSDPDHDPVVKQLREQISDNDRAVVEAINKRLKLVGRLRDYLEPHRESAERLGHLNAVTAQ